MKKYLLNFRKFVLAMILVVFGAGALRADTGQTITFPSVADTVSGAPPFALGATASSGLPVSYSVVSGPVTISSNVVSIMAAGTAVIKASQAGNDSFTPATNVVQSFEINRFQWTTNSGGNGHYYEVKYPGPAGINWTNAQNDAVSAGGYLATITSAAEDQFVFNLVNANTNLWVFSSLNKFGPLTGGYKVVDTNGVPGWAWVTGEPFTYQNWGPNRPNSSSSVDRIQYFTRDSDATNDTLTDGWSDLPDNGRSLGYVVEYDTSPDSRLNQSINFPAIPNQTYGTAPITLAATSSSGLPVTYTIVYGQAAISNNALIVKGVGGVTVCASVDGNNLYYSRSNVNQQFYVNRAGLSVTAANFTGPYGDTNRNFTGTVTGLVASDGIIVGYSTTATAGSIPGTYPITPVLTDPNNRLANYVVSTTNAVLSVTLAPLSVTANNATRLYGAANPVWSGVLNGVKNGDNITASYSCAAVATSPIGTYPIVPQLSDPGSKLANYLVSITDGALTVSDAVVSAAPVLLPPVYQAANGGSVTLAWSAVTGFGYQVQYKTALNSTDWTNLGSIVNATGSTASATDNSPTGASRFYRVILLVP